MQFQAQCCFCRRLSQDKKSVSFNNNNYQNCFNCRSCSCLQHLLETQNQCLHCQTLLQNLKTDCFGKGYQCKTIDQQVKNSFVLNSQHDVEIQKQCSNSLSFNHSPKQYYLPHFIPKERNSTKKNKNQQPCKCKLVQQQDQLGQPIDFEAGQENDNSNEDGARGQINTDIKQDKKVVNGNRDVKEIFKISRRGIKKNKKSQNKLIKCQM